MGGDRLVPPASQRGWWSGLAAGSATGLAIIALGPLIGSLAGVGALGIAAAKSSDRLMTVGAFLAGVGTLLAWLALGVVVRCGGVLACGTTDAAPLLVLSLSVLVVGVGLSFWALRKRR